MVEMLTHRRPRSRTHFLALGANDALSWHRVSMPSARQSKVKAWKVEIVPGEHTFTLQQQPIPWAVININTVETEPP